MRPSVLLDLLLATSLWESSNGLHSSFVPDLEECIRNHALKLAATFPEWGDKCTPATHKVDYQAKVYEETLTPFFNKYGYHAALWCATYSLGMVPIVDTSQPNNPNFDIWYNQLLCPWNFPDDCGASDDELSADELAGVYVCEKQEWRGKTDQKGKYDPHRICAPNQHPQYAIWPYDQWQNVEPLRKTMSCALCGRLSRTFKGGAPVGAPDKIENNIGVKYSLAGVPDEQKKHFTAWWDMHPFGAWLANEAAKNEWKGAWKLDELVENINVWKASNGEEIHGFLWQSLRLLAYDTGTLQGTRTDEPEFDTAVLHAFKVCKPSWWLSPQSKDDCSHAAGHGFFYYYMDIGRAISACWDDRIVLHTPGQEYSWDQDPRMSGLGADTLLMWRWLCATGVYHAASNTLSNEVLYEVGQKN